MSGIEVHTVKGAVGSRHFSVEDFDASTGTYTVSPDGQTLSLLVVRAGHRRDRLVRWARQN